MSELNCLFVIDKAEIFWVLSFPLPALYIQLPEDFLPNLPCETSAPLLRALVLFASGVSATAPSRATPAVCRSGREDAAPCGAVNELRPQPQQLLCQKAAQRSLRPVHASVTPSSVPRCAPVTPAARLNGREKPLDGPHRDAAPPADAPAVTVLPQPPRTASGTRRADAERGGRHGPTPGGGGCARRRPRGGLWEPLPTAGADAPASPPEVAAEPP